MQPSGIQSKRFHAKNINIVIVKSVLIVWSEDIYFHDANGEHFHISVSDRRAKSAICKHVMYNKMSTKVQTTPKSNILRLQRDLYSLYQSGIGYYQHFQSTAI